MVKILEIINEEFIAPNECLAVIFADSKEELLSEYSVSGLPTGRTLAPGCKFKTADGSEGYLKSDGTIEWVVEPSDLPPVDSSDNGKVLVVEDGQWAVGESPVTPEDIQQAVDNYCEANFSEWAGGLDSGLTQPLMAAPADKVGELKSALTSIKTTNNALMLTDKIENYIGYNNPTASQYYDYFDYVPVTAGVTYYLNFSSRFVVYYDSSKTYTNVYEENKTSFTPSVNGFVRLTIEKAAENYANPKIWASTQQESDIIDYGKYLLGSDIYAQNVTEELQGRLDGRWVTKEKINAFDSTTSVNGLLVNTGGVTPSNSYRTTGYMQVKANHKYVIGYFRVFLAYDSTKNVISGSWEGSEAYNYLYEPSADGYVRWSYYPNDESEQTFVHYVTVGDGNKIYEGIALSEYQKGQVKTVVQDYSGNVLSGKKWWACGDSFTEWAPDSYNVGELPNIDGLAHKKSYPYWIAKRNPLLTVYNFAVSGQTMAMPAVPGDFTNAFSNDKYKIIPSDVDYITLYFGINDSHHRPGSSGGDDEDNEGEIPLGTINDDTTDTFYGAWNVVLEYLITNYPWAKIGIIITNGAETEDYPTAEIQLAKKWGIPYLDLNGDYKLPLMLRSEGKTEVCETAVNIRKSQQWTSPTAPVNGHPNTNAHKFESTFIENWLRSL